MTINKWTVGLASLGLVSLSPTVLAQSTGPTQVPVLTSLSATTISGYVDTSAVWNPGTGNAHPAPFAFNAGKQDGFNLDSLDVAIAKPQDETGWSAGYRAEIMLGPDGTTVDSGAYPIRQAFIALHMPVGNGIDWQLGRWDNILGYESSDDYKNPNWSRSYAYTFEPTEHTGLLGTYSITSAISLQAGVADTVTTLGVNSRTTSTPITAIESKKSFVSLLTLTAPDSWGSFKGSALYAGFDYGQGAPQNDVAGPGVIHPGKDKKEIYVGTTINTPVTGLTFGAAWDSIFHNDIGGEDYSYFQAIAGYASYKATDKLTLIARGEYADGEGLQVISASGMDEVLAVTGTLQYDLWANVISRLEIRWDHSAKGGEAFGGAGAAGSPSLPDKKNDVLVAANLIYKF
jgi:hypothetical protein